MLETLTRAEIARLLNRSHFGVTKAIIRLGIKPTDHCRSRPLYNANAVKRLRKAMRGENKKEEA